MISLLFSIALAKEVSGLELIQSAVDKYNKADAVKMVVHKKVVLSLLDQTKESQGQLYFSKGKLRLEINEPDASVIVLNDQAVWVQTTTEGFNGPSQHVMKIASKDLKNRSKAPLAMLLTDKKSWKDFKVLKTDSKSDFVHIWLAPKDVNKYPELSKVNIRISKVDSQIQKLTYEDEIENEVTYEFTEADFSTPISPKKFQYKPPKGAELVVY